VAARGAGHSDDGGTIGDHIDSPIPFQAVDVPAVEFTRGHRNRLPVHGYRQGAAAVDRPSIGEDRFDHVVRHRSLDRARSGMCGQLHDQGSINAITMLASYAMLAVLSILFVRGSILRRHKIR
jgi:hypothetical protein